MRKKITVMIMILIVLLTMFSPVATDRINASTEIDQLVMTMNPGMLGWLLTQWGSMGFAGGNLSEQLDYLNRNGNIDQYFADVWADFQTDVDVIEGLATNVYRATGYLWQDLFAGDPLRHIVGTKQMFDESTDPESPYYIDFENANNYYDGMKVWRIDQQVSPVNYFRSLTYDQARAVQVANGITSYETTLHSYQIDRNLSASKWYIRFKKVLKSNQTWETLFNPREYLTTSNGSYVPVISYINAAGAPDQNGNIYKLDLLPVAHIMFDTNWMECDDQVEPLIGSVNQSMITDDAVDIDFNSEVLGNVVTDEDITADDYVLYEINRDLIEQIQELQMKISMNEDTAEDWVLNPPEVVRVETTNTIIREVIQAESAVIPSEIEWPETQEWEVPSMVTTRFPFSIPWDLARAYEMMVEDPVVPVFELPFVIESLNIDMSMTIDLAMFEPLARICRWFFMALFMLGLILSTRSLIKG